MFVTLQQWGNSLAFRLPKTLAKQVHVKKGSRLDLTVKENTIVLKAQEQPTFSLKVLLKKYKPSQKHEVIDIASVQGKEVW